MSTPQHPRRLLLSAAGVHARPRAALSATRAAPHGYAYGRQHGAGPAPPGLTHGRGLSSVAATALALGVGSAQTQSGTPAATYMQAVLADKPLGYWMLSETSGTSAADSSGYGYDGTYTNGPTLAEPALINAGYSVLFASASTQYVDIPVASGDSHFYTGALTLEGWVKTSTKANYQAIVDMDNNNIAGRLFQLRLTSAGVAQLVIIDSGATAHTLTGATDICDGAAHYVVATADGSGADIYLDGSATPDASVTWSITLNTNTSSHLHIATRVYGNQNPMNGYLDQVAVYGDVLTTARITAHYAAGTS